MTHPPVTQLLVVPDDGSTALLAVARELMEEYAALPHIDGRWTTVARDLAKLPHPFVAPDGLLLVATSDDVPVGCGALRAMADAGTAEIKRVYVRPDARGRGVGDALMRALMAHAVAIGRPRVRLDTAPELLAAQALYLRLGFTPIPRYDAGMLPDTLCFEWTAPTAE